MKDIIRFKRNGRQQLIHRNVTLEQAQEWCGSPVTHTPGKWFDGYADTGTHCTSQQPKYATYHTPYLKAV